MRKESEESYYESRAVRDEYLAFHYPGNDPLRDLLGDAAPPLEQRFPFAVRRLWEPRPESVALDVGAAAGRVTFDLAQDHRLAVGIDRSRMLIHAAQAVRDAGEARYRVVIEGRLEQERRVPAPAGPAPRFGIGDALALPFREAGFATVVALNLVDRVPDPARLVAELARVVAPGGRLILGSPFTWMEEFTPFERWLGGYLRDGRPVRGAGTLRRLLAKGFTLLQEVRLPFFIPHHARSGQLGVAHILSFSRNP